MLNYVFGMKFPDWCKQNNLNYQNERCRCYNLVKKGMTLEEACLWHRPIGRQPKEYPHLKEAKKISMRIKRSGYSEEVARFPDDVIKRLGVQKKVKYWVSEYTLKEYCNKMGWHYWEVVLAMKAMRLTPHQAIEIFEKGFRVTRLENLWKKNNFKDIKPQDRVCLLKIIGEKK